MIFYLLPLVCATALEVKAHVDHFASYQIGFNTLARVHEELRGPAKTEFMGFFDDDPSVFRGAETAALSSSVDFKDIRPAFERIYDAAKRGYVKDAFAFLLKLKKIPHYFEFVSCFS